MLCDSIKEEWFTHTTSDAELDTVSPMLSDMTSLKNSLPVTRRTQSPMMAVTFIDSDEYPNELEKLYNPILRWIDPNLRLFLSADGGDVADDTLPANMAGTLDMPSLAIIVFLQEEEMIGDDRLSKAKQYFSSVPWKFHHSEWVSAYHIKAYEYNSHDYFLPAEDLPLCSVRQIHCGGEHLRVVRFVTAHNWQDTINLYKLLLGQDPAFVKLDFCVFTLESHANFDLQFALKKLPRGVVPRHSARAVLTIQVPDVTHLAPLLPVTLTHIGGSRWSTRDLDGNQLLLDVVQVVNYSVNHQIHNIRATDDLPKRLSPRAEIPTDEQSHPELSSRPVRNEHRKLKTRRVKPPKSHNNKFAHSGPGSSFRPVSKHTHQRTDSGFIEGPRSDILTDIAIDAIHKLGQRANFFTSEESPPDSPWESQSNNSDLHDTGMGSVDTDHLSGTDITPCSVLDSRSPDWSPQHESGFGDTSDLESIREYPIDCSGLVSVGGGHDGTDSRLDREKVDLPLTTHRTLKDLTANWSDSNSDSESSVKVSPLVKEKVNLTDTAHIPSETQHADTEVNNWTSSYAVDHSDAKEEVNSFLESLKQREIRRNYASRIGAHGTLSSGVYQKSNGEDHLSHETLLDRTKLPPPPLPPKPKFKQPGQVSYEGNGITLPMSDFEYFKSAQERCQKARTQKRVTFQDDISIKDNQLDAGEMAVTKEPLGFWI